jgi:hypothetical protein
MKVCSYCGKQYGESVELCPVDQHPLSVLEDLRAGEVSPKVVCPECGAADDYTGLIARRSSFSVITFLLGGILAVMFRNAGSPRRVKCNKCEARFDLTSPFSKFSQVIYWLLVTPAIIGLLVMVAWFIFILLSH